MLGDSARCLRLPPRLEATFRVERRRRRAVWLVLLVDHVGGWQLTRRFRTCRDLEPSGLSRLIDQVFEEARLGESVMVCQERNQLVGLLGQPDVELLLARTVNAGRGVTRHPEPSFPARWPPEEAPFGPEELLCRPAPARAERWCPA